MGVKVITPAETLITMAELCAHCRVIDTADDDELFGFLASAHEYCQHETGRSIGVQTLELAIDEFPCGAIDLPNGPVTSIEFITYVDTNGVTQTLSDVLYTLDDYDLQCRVWPAFGTQWPATQLVPNAVKVRYVAGSLPAAVKSAMLLIVGHLNENRENTVAAALQELPLGVNALLGTSKVWGR